MLSFPGGYTLLLQSQLSEKILYLLSAWKAYET